MVTCIENTDVDYNVSKSKVKYGLDGIFNLRKKYITFEKAYYLDEYVLQLLQATEIDYLKPLHPLLS